MKLLGNYEVNNFYLHKWPNGNDKFDWHSLFPRFIFRS